jgi:hypothetical protein
MAYNEKLAARLRQALEEIPKVEEKEMFRGLTFMVDGKMCISVSGEELLCRIDPDLQDTVLERGNCREMIHGGRTMKGFIYVSQDGIKTKKDFEFWVNACLGFNGKAKASPKKKKKK